MAESNPFRKFNNALLVNGDMSQPTLTSLYQDVSEITAFAVQAVWSGASPVGTLNFNGSNDNITYTTIASGSVSGNTGSILSSGTGMGYAFIQCVYTSASGTGSLTITINGERR